MLNVKLRSMLISQKCVFLCVNLRKYIKPLVNIAWYNTFIQSQKSCNSLKVKIVEKLNGS